jgi:hypothetical protein
VNGSFAPEAAGCEQLLHTPKSVMERRGPSAAQVARDDELQDHIHEFLATVSGNG